MTLGPNEKSFKVNPVGIKYICEACGIGEMKYKNDNPPVITMEYPTMYTHVCEYCGINMRLPKIYPYIEWVPEDNE